MVNHQSSWIIFFSSRFKSWASPFNPDSFLGHKDDLWPGCEERREGLVHFKKHRICMSKFSLTPIIFPVFFFHSRNGLLRKEGIARNLGLVEYLNIFQTETSSSNWKSSYDGFWPSLFHSWDEMARYDLPAMLKFVVSKTSQPSLYYVGHSQGTLIAFAEFSRNKELAKLVKRFFALGPVTTTGHIESPIKYFRHLGPELEVRINTWQLLPVSPSPFSLITE